MVLGLVAYAIAFFIAARTWDIPSIGRRAAAFLALALALELTGKVLFALLFRYGLRQHGAWVTVRSAIYGAMVGTAVARLIPAGGALTPSAMAWAVRAENEQAAGAGLRATLASYAGLLVLTGGALAWGVSSGRHPALLVGSVVIGIVMAVIGVAVLVGNRWLDWTVSKLPRWLRQHFGPTAGGGHLSIVELFLVLCRIVVEAGVVWAAMQAFSIDLSPVAAMTAFGVSTIVGGIPSTPGGLGLVEGGLVGVLVRFGNPLNTVVAPVLVYRIIDYWIIAGLGVLAAARVARPSGQ